LATGDTEFLRLTLNIALRQGLQPVRLVHALQNHDEMTYELVHFAIAHRDDTFRFRGEQLTGAELAVKIRGELTARLTGEAAPYNAIFTTNGIASTIPTIIAATLGYPDITNLSPGQIERIKRAHLLLAMFNAMQPGVFALSGWDLCGMLTLERSKVSELLGSGDTRWIHRAAYDLMNYQSEGGRSLAHMPRGASLYGSLPDQLQEVSSFASRLHDLLTVRARYGISTAVQVDIPEVTDKAMLVMVHRLDTGQVQVSVLNFAGRTVAGRVESKHLPAGGRVIDMFTDQVIAEVDHDCGFAVSLQPHQGISVLAVPGAA
jgi:trehalose synthase